MGLLPNGSWGAGAGSNLSVRQGRPPPQGQHVFLSRTLCGYLWWFSGGVNGKCGDPPYSPSHLGGCLLVTMITFLPVSQGLSGKGVTMSIPSAWTEGVQLREAKLLSEITQQWMAALSTGHSLPVFCGSPAGQSTAKPASYPLPQVPRPHP